MKIETKRLIIRPFTPDDLPEFRKLLAIGELPGWVMQQNRAENFLNWQISNYEKMDIVNGAVCFGIFDKTDGRILGNTGAGEHDDLHEPEIFYALLTSERGKGYAAEAAEALTEWIFANYDIPYLIGTAEESNTASQRVLEKCGYTCINTQTLKVHIMNESYSFRYYRRYSNCISLPQELADKGFALCPASAADLNDFVRVKMTCYRKYVEKFYGNWNDADQIQRNTERFYKTRGFTNFTKILFHENTAGFFSYDVREDRIAAVTLQMTEEARNLGMGSFILRHILALGKQIGKPVYLRVFKTNPAKRLYERFGFTVYDETESHFLMRHASAE